MTNPVKTAISYGEDTLTFVLVVGVLIVAYQIYKAGKVTMDAVSSGVTAAQNFITNPLQSMFPTNNASGTSANTQAKDPADLANYNENGALVISASDLTASQRLGVITADPSLAFAKQVPASIVDPNLAGVETGGEPDMPSIGSTELFGPSQITGPQTPAVIADPNFNAPFGA